MYLRGGEPHEPTAVSDVAVVLMGAVVFAMSEFCDEMSFHGSVYEMTPRVKTQMVMVALALWVIVLWRTVQRFRKRG